MNAIQKRNPVFSSIFDDLFLENKLDLPNYETFSIPKVNIQEKFTSFVIELAIPGLKKEDFSIQVEENTLKIASISKEKAETKNQEEDSKFTRKEFNYNSFKRSFTLPKDVLVDDIVANYEAGVLKISIPKMEKKEVKKMIEIS